MRWKPPAGCAAAAPYKLGLLGVTGELAVLPVSCERRGDHVDKVGVLAVGPGHEASSCPARW